MRFVGLTVLLGILALAPSPIAAIDEATKNVSNLRCVGIVIEDMPKEAISEGIDKNTLKEHLLVSMKSKIPRLAISEECEPNYMYLNVMFMPVNSRGKDLIGYAACIRLELNRRGVITEADRAAFVSVWNRSIIIFKSSDPASYIFEQVDELVTGFAAAYYEVND